MPGKGTCVRLSRLEERREPRPECKMDKERMGHKPGWETLGSVWRVSARQRPGRFLFHPQCGRGWIAAG